MLVSVDAQATFTALRMTDVRLCVCVFSVCWSLTSLSSVGLYLLTLFPCVPHNIQDNTSHIGWTVTGSMTLSWIFQSQDSWKTEAKHMTKRRLTGLWDEGETRKDYDTWMSLSCPRHSRAGLGTAPFQHALCESCRFDIWKFYLMHSVLRSHFWGLLDILMCATH